MLLPALPAAALNPALDVSQYAHTAWSIRGSGLTGSPTSFAQTPDGYLWLGTEFGILRFDGVRFAPWRPVNSAHIADASIVKLLAARDGSLWIATHTALARWHDQRLDRYKELDGRLLTTLLEDKDGIVWAGTSGGLTGTGSLCALTARDVTCETNNGQFGRFVISLYEDRRGRLWAGTATGLWQWKPGSPTRYPAGDLTEIHSITETEDGTLLLAVNRGLQQLRNGRLEDYPLGGDGRLLKPTYLLRDHGGAIWMGTQDGGLVHLHHGRSDRFNHADGLSGNFVADLFEDREGNVWTATFDGLDHFREFAVSRLSSKQGLMSDSVAAVLAARDGTVWIATLGGLARWSGGHISAHPMQPGRPDDAVASLFEDSRGRIWVSSPRGLSVVDHDRSTPVRGQAVGYVQAMAEDSAGQIWLSDQDRGLVRVVRETAVEVIPWSALGGRHARSIAFDPARNGLWLGFFEGGLSFFRAGHIEASYDPAQGLGSGQVSSVRVDHDGAVWAATAGGLSRLHDGRLATLTAAHGLPCDVAHWSLDDRAGNLWLDTVCGLVRIGRADVAAWIRHPQQPIAAVTYDDTDGVTHHSDSISYSPKVTRTADGLLLFATPEGLGVLDPDHVPNNQLVPPVHVEQVTADRSTFDAARGLRLPPLVRDVRIDYTAPSFVVPERVRFRYKLEGHDTDWTDAGNRRQAFYTNLPPKQYRFRVLAANNDGVWNDTGATWEFSIIPAFYETTTFKAAVAIGLLALTWVLYRVRLRRVAAQLNVRFEERLAERMRIARDLHDTLLQGFTSVSMQLHVLADQLADHPARSTFERILQRVTQVVDDGRRTVQGLRESHVEDLVEALVRDAKEIRGQQDVDIRLIVEGSRRPLGALERDEVYRIVREGLTNAFRHAGATEVEIEFEYCPTELKVHVRDNGCGIDADVLASGREGHWGLHGMRERAEQLGARLEVWSRLKGGTEVALTLPTDLSSDRSPAHLRRLWQTWTRRLGRFERRD